MERWAKNVGWQHFYESRLPCDVMKIGRFRSAIGEAGVEGLLKATIGTAAVSKASRKERCAAQAPLHENGAREMKMVSGKFSSPEKFLTARDTEKTPPGT